MNDCCCVYLCKKKIIFQLDFLKNNKPFATLGINFNQGCYNCKINGFTSCSICCNCKCKNVLLLRLYKEPNNADFSHGKFLGISTTINKTCCRSFSNTVEITDENKNLKWIIGLIKKCCNCECLNCEEIYIDKKFIIYDSKRKKCGEIIVPLDVVLEN